MAIGRLYYTIASLLCCALYAATHYEPWPEKGFRPHSGFGNRWKYKYKKEREAEAPKAAREAEEEARRIAREASEEARRVARQAAEDEAREYAELNAPRYPSSSRTGKGSGLSDGGEFWREKARRRARDPRRGRERERDGRGDGAGARDRDEREERREEEEEIKPIQRWR